MSWNNQNWKQAFSDLHKKLDAISNLSWDAVKINLYITYKREQTSKSSRSKN